MLVPTDAAPPGQPSAIYRCPFVSLVALLTWRDLLFRAKDLFVTAWPFSGARRAVAAQFAQPRSRFVVRAGAALPWGAKIFRVHRLARNGLNEQIFGADEQIPKVGRATKGRSAQPVSAERIGPNRPLSSALL
jgi:hypothetical protein